jgi:hypothetical protein
MKQKPHIVASSASKTRIPSFSVLFIIFFGGLNQIRRPKDDKLFTLERATS